MKTNSQKQVAAFDQVLGLCNDLGQKYNPGNDSINLAALNSLLTSAQEKVKAAHTAKMNLTEVINARQQAFARLPAIGTRILNVLIASDASPQRIEDVRAYRDKLRGRSGKTAKPEDSTNPAKPAVPGDASRGPISYLDYESRLESFRSIIELAGKETRYNPNEPEFSIASLTTLADQLAEMNVAVNQARLAYGNARSARNATLYSDAGLFGVTKRVKKYVLYACGATSEEFRRVNGVSLKSR
jgi:hypothetical protein